MDETNKTQWRPLNERENPVYGWVVMNYADYAIQFFLEDGTFYRELRFGGPAGSTITPAWTPFAAPQAESVPAQLDNLIQALSSSSNPTYLHALYDLISLAFGQLQPADSSYAQFLNSVIGRPLSLVNIGVSIELAAYPLSNESNTPGAPPQYTLLGDTSSSTGKPGSTPLDTPTPSKSGSASKPSSTSTGTPVPRTSGSVGKTSSVSTGASKPPTPPTPPTSQPYSFPLQLGDRERSYDGLFGFWKPLATPTQALDNSFDFNSMYTFWPDTKYSNLQPLLPDSLALKAFTVAPDQLDGNNTWTIVQPTDQTSQRNAHLQVVSALIDPFQNVHAFSATLPTVSIKLPRWTTEQALGRMTAFFQAGPVMLATPVPAYDPACLLKSSDDLSTAPIAGKVGLPALKVGTWRWLQPFESSTPSASDGEGAGSASEGSATGGAPTTPTAPLPNCNPFNVVSVDARPRFEPGPYTMVEGYLQLAESLVSGEGPSTSGKGSTH